MTEADLNAIEPDVRLQLSTTLVERKREGIPGFNLPDDLIERVGRVGIKVEFNPFLGDALATTCLMIGQDSLATCQLMIRVFENPRLPLWFHIGQASGQISR